MRFQAQNAGERSEFGSQTAIHLTNRPELRGFLPARKPRRFAGSNCEPLSDAFVNFSQFEGPGDRARNLGPVHAPAVVLASLERGENLVRAMSVVECRLECHCCGALRLALSLAPNGWSLRQERSRRAASSRDARKEAERRFGLTTARTSPTTYITALWPAFAGSGRWGCWLGDDRSHDCDLPRLRRRTHRQTARRSQTHRIRERFAVRILFAGFRVWRTRARRLARD